MQKNRVLIFQAANTDRAKLSAIARLADCEVDSAATKADALEKLRCRTYHVAIIDMPTTFLNEGLECLEYISRLNEGTRSIVLSASNDIRAPIEAFKQGVFEYVIRQDIRSAEDIERFLTAGLKRCELNLYGEFNSLIPYLAYPEMSVYFEHALINVLGTNHTAMVKIMDTLFEDLVPVLRQRQVTTSFVFDKTQNTLQGVFWSKSLGQAVWIGMSAGDAAPPMPSANVQPIGFLSELTRERLLRHRWPGKAEIWLASNARTDFEETLFHPTASRMNVLVSARAPTEVRPLAQSADTVGNGTLPYDDLFLSHTHADKPFVRRLKATLERKGVKKVWIDEAEIMIGDSLLQKIEEGLKRTRYIAVVLSPESMSSKWVRKELEIAMNREIASGQVVVLPLLYKPCDLPDFLKGKLYGDFTSPSSYRSSLNTLLRRLKSKQ